MSRQECPSCGKHWTPPGPCGNWDPHYGEVCGFTEQPRLGDRARPAKVPIPADGWARTGRPVDPTEHLAAARRQLALAVERKTR